MADLRDSNYTLDFVSEEKRNVQYVSGPRPSWTVTWWLLTEHEKSGGGRRGIVVVVDGGSVCNVVKVCGCVPARLTRQRRVARHENWLRTLSPSLSTLIGGYKQQMQRIGNMIQSVVVGACAGNSFLIVLLFSVIIRALVTSLQNLQ